MYRKINIILAVVVSIFLLCEFIGHSNKDVSSEKAIIQLAKLTQKEKTLLHAGGENLVFVYDFHLSNHHMKALHYWIDFYKNGKKQGDPLNGTLSIAGASGRLIFAIDKTKNHMVRGIVTLGGKNGYSQVFGSVEFHSLKGMSVTSQNQRSKIKPGKPITLAVNVRDPHTSSISMTNNIFHDPSAIHRLISRYQSVYVFRCAFGNFK